MAMGRGVRLPDGALRNDLQTASIRTGPRHRRPSDFDCRRLHPVPAPEPPSQPFRGWSLYIHYAIQAED